MESIAEADEIDEIDQRLCLRLQGRCEVEDLESLFAVAYIQPFLRTAFIKHIWGFAWEPLRSAGVSFCLLVITEICKADTTYKLCAATNERLAA